MKRTMIQDIPNKVIQYKQLFSALKKEGRRGAVVMVAEMCGVHRNTVRRTLKEGVWGPKEKEIVDAAICVIDSYKKKEELLTEDVHPVNAGATLL